jgi:hypothetical protein
VSHQHQASFNSLKPICIVYFSRNINLNIFIAYFCNLV